MSSFEFLATKLNIHGPADVAGHAKPALVMQDVYAAAAGLDRQSWAMGQAIFTKDPLAIQEAYDLGFVEVVKLFGENDWSPTKPFRSQVNRRIKSGEISAEQGDRIKTMLGSQLQYSLAVMAVCELLRDRCPACRGLGVIPGRYSHDSHLPAGMQKRDGWYWYVTPPRERKTEPHVEVLLGTNIIHAYDRYALLPIDRGHQHVTCTVCWGTRKVAFNTPRRAAAVGIHESTWRKTWSSRYATVQGTFATWVQTYKDHITKRAR